MTSVPSNPPQPAPQRRGPWCSQCGHEMTGLRPSEGRLTCPECGAQTSSGPLSTADLGEVDAAKKRGKKIWRAVRVANFDAWTAAVIGGSALAFGLIDRTSAIVGGAIMTVAIIEFKGAARLRKLDPAGALICGANQLLLLGVIAAYCAWNLLTQSSSSLTQSLGDPAGDALLADVAGLETKIRQGFYFLVLGGSVLMQGLMALYYFSRAGVVRRYVRETPPWVIELQRRSL